MEKYNLHSASSSQSENMVQFRQSDSRGFAPTPEKPRGTRIQPTDCECCHWEAEKTNRADFFWLENLSEPSAAAANPFSLSCVGTNGNGNIVQHCSTCTRSSNSSSSSLSAAAPQISRNCLFVTNPLLSSSSSLRP